MKRRPPLEIGGHTVAAGRRANLELPLGRQVTGAALSLPLIVLHGRHEGPTMWITACIHGDEINGVEIIRRVLAELDPRQLHGTLLAIPIVNVAGFTVGDRYLPDRRDLNRSFPGSRRGSLASRIAHVLMTEVISSGDFGIDLHTGSDHRTNLPQIRANLEDPRTRGLAEAFGPPVMLHAAIRDGSLRQSAADQGGAVLLYEAGEAWRFDEDAIRIGTSGCLRVLAHAGMTPDLDPPEAGPAPIVSHGSRWARARRSGIAQIWSAGGSIVTKGQTVGRIHDAFGAKLSDIKANETGLIIGHSLAPIVNQGDALVHIAAITPPDLPTPDLPTTDSPTEPETRP